MQNNQSTLEIKQAFLASAISDISSYIHLADTKVSIIMAAVVAFLVGLASCYNSIDQILLTIVPCSWRGVSLLVLTILFCVSIVLVFLFGLLTVKSHVSIIAYQSKWFLPQSTKEYSFDKYLNDVHEMTADDVIDNMIAELYKLNNINRQKATTLKWTLRSFAGSLVFLAGIVFLLLAK